MALKLGDHEMVYDKWIERNDWHPIINGHKCPPISGDYFDVEEPATGKLLTRVAAGGEADIDKAVRAARSAYDQDWRRRSPRERGRMLLRVAAIIRENIEELARLETREVGKPLDQSRNYDLQGAADTFEYYGGLADKLEGQFILAGPINAFIIPEPYGVIGAILPFNWPPAQLAGKAAPALAAGNTIVVKPPEQAPLTVIRIVELMQGILPPGAINVVPGLGSPAGAALVSHRLLGKISFTGSTMTGRKVLVQAAENITPALVELGGKNPILVFPDADLEIALRGALEGMFFNQGEACTAASRILLHTSICKQFLEKFCVAVDKLNVGDGLDESTEIGPLVTRQQQERVLSLIKIGQREGGRIIAQGRLPEDPRLKEGFFVPPTVFDEVQPEMQIAREEIFGPVCCIFNFSTYDEAIRIANDSEFGLAAGIFTTNLDTAQRAMRDVEAGVVTINNYFRGWLGTPFGGMKNSGFGREYGIETMREYVRSKNVRATSGFGTIPRWRAVERLL
jgi:acyl-CoA reductase-like NAD-dependent aldehyde dehydrogenase